MARLNDVPAPPTESIDALKRRFIRQNREIARVNSTQSQRIRNLETEISRLVAENISLREQTIAAQAEAERWRNANNVNREIMEMKERMEKKVTELTSLIVEMGHLPEKAAEKSRRRSGVQKQRDSTEQGWLNRQSMREAVAGDRELYDGRLPAIQEDKLYPRRTLESAEIMAIRDEEALQQASESPELGPPPVAHFDVTEPIAFDSSTITATATEHNNSEDLMQLHSTLEKRRKRRTSSLLQDMQTEPVSEPPVPEEPVPQLLKSGAKRKLDVTELEDASPRDPGENDEFIFQRKPQIWNNPAAVKKASRFTRAPGRENEKPIETSATSPQKTTAGSRKILAPKSTNSPTKRRVHVSEKLGDLKDGRDGMPKHSANDSPRKIPEREIRDIVLDPSGAVESDRLPPKTPAAQGDHILSPISTEPSARNTHLPREAAVLNSVEDVLNGSIGRGSRRARAAVSYAEPNLRDKMRRPGKELVGAVEGLAKGKESTSTSRSRGPSLDQTKSEGMGGTEAKDGATTGKREQGAAGNDRWQGLAISGSGKKEEPPSPLKDKERRDIIRDKGNPNTVNDLQGQTNRRQRYSDELEKAVDRLKIFDPPVSSPIGEPKSPSTVEDDTPAATSRRKGPGTAVRRRHSTQPASASVPNPAAGDPPRTLRTSDSTSNPKAPVPRPSSAASVRHHAGIDVDDKHLKRSSSVSSNLRASHETNRPDLTMTSSSKSAAAADGRNERMANRRRSMMV
ncbi:hypothetical protein A1O1_08828 [Capronia coronata CBS 617.96]|uniref:Shugoshin C-terminal domain-containing protein n=1 Tax=Capronia coronata CBS 617.96 TaxID=1182541 RepID=W9XE20_9EURO|nr:uncharacterized protein A1O1_08828 [Capronia coronata CBS 617.96]EXJ78428.1 hypothetical protein A1O1_08828 [Capronia coronata CBS 617.96]